MQHRVVIVLFAMLLGACQGMHGPASHRTGSQTHDTSWPLLAPASLGRTVSVTQTLQGERDGQRFNLQCAVTVNGASINAIGVTALGLRAFTLQYDGVQLNETRAPQVPQLLEGRRLLNDLQFVFWPLAAVQEAWQKVGGEVSEPVPGTRRLQRDGTVLAEAYYAGEPWSGRVWLRHFDYDYVLVVDSTPMEESRP